MAIIESLLGFGLLAGPLIGGVLYKYGGFYLPFLVTGGTLAMSFIIALFILKYKFEYGPALRGTTKESMTKFSTLLKIPQVTTACLIQGICGISVSWYLPAMQPFLEAEFHLSEVETGGLLMLDGVMYALATPLWGWAIDAGLLSPLKSLFIGSICLIVGYSFLGSDPILFFLPSNVYMVGIGMALNGLGMSLYFLSTYMLMLTSSVESGFVQDTEQTQGMLTALWDVVSSIGGYLGSTGGGWAFDTMGFRKSTYVIIGTQVFSILSLFVMWLVEQRQKKDKSRENGYQTVPGIDICSSFDEHESEEAS